MSGFVGSAFAQVQLTPQEFSQQEIDEMKKKAVLITMNGGTFMIEFFPEDAPNTVHNFLKLVESGYYDGIVFHRIIPGFMIQTGDPNTKDPDADQSSWGQGGPGYQIKKNSTPYNTTAALFLWQGLIIQTLQVHNFLLCIKTTTN